MMNNIEFYNSVVPLSNVEYGEVRYGAVRYSVLQYDQLTTGTVYELISGREIQLLGPKRSPMDLVIKIDILWRPEKIN